jgi:hypothetical protein
VAGDWDYNIWFGDAPLLAAIAAVSQHRQYQTFRTAYAQTFQTLFTLRSFLNFIFLVVVPGYIFSCWLKSVRPVRSFRGRLQTSFLIFSPRFLNPLFFDLSFAILIKFSNLAKDRS